MRNRDEQQIECLVTCKDCGRRIAGSITLNLLLQVVDSDQFTIFSDGPECDACLTAKTGVHPATPVNDVGQAVELVTPLLAHDRVLRDRLLNRRP